MSARDELWQLVNLAGNVETDRMEIGRATDAIIAAGYRKPRTITTIGDLAGDFAGMVILTAHGRIFEYTGRHWTAPGLRIDYQPIIDWLPATVLWEPTA